MGQSWNRLPPNRRKMFPKRLKSVLKRSYLWTAQLGDMTGVGRPRPPQWLLRLIQAPPVVSIKSWVQISPFSSTSTTRNIAENRYPSSLSPYRSTYYTKGKVSWSQISLDRLPPHPLYPGAPSSSNQNYAMQKEEERERHWKKKECIRRRRTDKKKNGKKEECLWHL